MQYDSFAITSLGGRAANEDSYGSFQFEDGRAFWIVADGLGGHSDGAVASRTAVATVSQWLQTKFSLKKEDLDAALQAAQSAIIANRKSPSSQMYTTIVLLVTDGVTASWAHVGDSRLYHFRAGKILTQTEDHSVPYLLYRAGEIDFSAIRTHKGRNQLLRSLGSDEPGKSEFSLEGPVPLEHSDAFVLCTDGFWELVLETEMETDFAMSANAKDWVRSMERRLQDKVHVGTGASHDNYTAIAIKPILGGLRSRPTTHEFRDC